MRGSGRHPTSWRRQYFASPVARGVHADPQLRGSNFFLFGKYTMGVRWFAFFIFVLLASQIQYVQCPSNLKDHSSPVCEPKDPETPTTDCTKASSQVKILSWVSSTLSCIILFAPVKRVLRLQSSDQDANAAQTLFRWSFFFGLEAYTLWSFYFLPFYKHPQCPGFPVLLACFLGAITNAVLLIAAIRKAPVVDGDPRKFGITLSIVTCLCAFLCKDTRIIGWVAVAFGVLSHSCRMASTDYYGSLSGLLLGASVVGGVNGFLWLIHPNLCLSFEYKVGSYIIGCLRGMEALLWLSRLVAPILSKMEGRILAPQPDQLEYELHLC